MQRVCVHENTHGIARSASSSPVPGASGRGRGREPISSRVSSSSGVNARRNRGSSGSSHTTDAVQGAGRAGRRPRSSPARPPAPRAIRSGTAVEERRCDGRLEIAPREAGETVLERDRLALLGHLQAPVHRVRRLGEDRRVRRPAAAPGAPAAAVEDGQLDAPLSREPGEPLLRAEDLPLRRHDAAVLARVRVADHHLEPSPGTRGREARPRAPRRRAGRRSSRAAAHGHVEPSPRRRATPRRGRRRPSASSRRSACRSPAFRAAAGAPRPPRAPRARRRLALAAACVHAQVERRHVQAEQLEAAPERGEPAVGDPRAAVAAQARVDKVELRLQLVGRRVAVDAEPLPDRRQPPPVRLGRVALRGRGRRRRPPRRRRRACSTCPRRRRARGRRGEKLADERRAAFDASRTVSAPAFGLPSRSPPIHVPNRSGVPGRRSPQTARRSGAASQRLSSRNQSACRISSTTRGRCERTSSVCQRSVISSASAPHGRAAPRA